MTGVLTGFGVVGSIIALGYLAARFDILGSGAEPVLARLAFNFGTPALMFSLLAQSRVADVFSPTLFVIVVSSLSTILIFGVFAIFLRWGTVRGIIGSLSSGYVNAGNLGIPVALYVLGEVTAIAPVMLFQLIVLAPIALSILDVATGEPASVGSKLIRPLKNPIMIAALSGLAVSISGLTIPEPVLQPFILLGQATVPVMLIGFGMGLYGIRGRTDDADRAPIALAVALKSFLQPAIALGAGLALGLSGGSLLAAVLCSSLPTAQNIYVYASRYVGATSMARQIVLITTITTIPVLLLLTSLVPALWP